MVVQNAKAQGPSMVSPRLPFNLDRGAWTFIGGPDDLPTSSKPLRRYPLPERTRRASIDPGRDLSHHTRLKAPLSFRAGACDGSEQQIAKLGVYSWRH